MKVCSRCKESKPHSDFGRAYKRPGYRSECRACSAARTKDWAERNPTRYRQSMRDWHVRSHQTVEGRASNLLTSAQQRARKAGRECTLTVSWIVERLSAGTCEVTGLPLDPIGPSKRPWGPSLDRIDNSKGYTPENTQIVCWAYNAAKGVAVHEDVLTLARALVQKYGAAA